MNYVISSMSNVNTQDGEEREDNHTKKDLTLDLGFFIKLLGLLILSFFVTNLFISGIHFTIISGFHLFLTPITGLSRGQFDLVGLTIGFGLILYIIVVRYLIKTPIKHQPANFEDRMGIMLTSGFLLGILPFYLFWKDCIPTDWQFGRGGGMKVVHYKTGWPCTNGQALLRNFSEILLFFLTGGLSIVISIILMTFTYNKRRIGDYIANTIVVDNRIPENLSLKYTIIQKYAVLVSLQLILLIVGLFQILCALCNIFFPLFFVIYLFGGDISYPTTYDSSIPAAFLCLIFVSLILIIYSWVISKYRWRPFSSKPQIRILPSDELSALLILENYIKKRIPVISHSSKKEFGVVIEKNHVTEIFLQKRELSSLPNIFHNFKELELLDISNNSFSKFDEWISGLSSLKTLNLSSNKLMKLTDSFHSFTSLVRLDISWNGISSLPKSINCLVNLKELNLEVNELNSFPNGFSSLENLRILKLKHNNFEEYSNELIKLQNLREIDFFGNEICSLPDTIGSMTNLEVFELGYNNIRSLPDSISQLKKLTKLNLGGNKFSSFPNVVTKLKSLKVINLNKNPFDYGQTGYNAIEWKKLQNFEELLEKRKNPS